METGNAAIYRQMLEGLSSEEKSALAEMLKNKMSPKRAVTFKKGQRVEEKKHEPVRRKYELLPIDHHYTCRCCGFSWVEEQIVAVLTKKREHVSAKGAIHLSVMTCENCKEILLWNCEDPITHLLNYIKQIASKRKEPERLISIIPIEVKEDEKS